MGVFKEGNIPAVVVKWYTRYFEGVVGISPCEFDSHLPHKETSSTGLVSFVFMQAPENLSIRPKNGFLFSVR